MQIITVQRYVSAVYDVSVFCLLFRYSVRHKFIKTAKLVTAKDNSARCLGTLVF